MAQARQWRSRPAAAEPAAPEPDLPAPAEEQSSAPETEEDLFAGTEFAHDAIRPEELRHLEEEPIPEGLAKDSSGGPGPAAGWATVRAWCTAC